MKKWLGISLAAMSALALAACGSGNTTTDNQTQAAAEGATGDAKVFTIGSSGPLTGPAASYGNSVKNGISLAIDEINAAGGVQVGDATYTLALNFQDDEASADKAVTAYNTVMDAGANVIIGATTSGSSLAIADLTKQDGILQITPSGSAKDITENDNVFRICFTDPLQGEMIADYLVEQGYNKIAVLYDNSDEYSTGVYEAFKAKLDATGNGSKLVAEASFVTADVDYTTQLTQFKAAEAEVIFVPAYYAAAAYITQQAKDAGMDVDFVGSDGWDGVLAQVTDKAAVEGAIFLSPFIASSEAVKPFVDAYNKAYGAIPDQFAADGYDAVYVVKAAMEKAGSIENADLIAAMTQIEVAGMTGNMTFDASGEPQKQAQFVVIENGEYKEK